LSASSASARTSGGMATRESYPVGGGELGVGCGRSKTRRVSHSPLPPPYLPSAVVYPISAMHISSVVCSPQRTSLGGELGLCQLSVELSKCDSMWMRPPAHSGERGQTFLLTAQRGLPQVEGVGEIPLPIGSTRLGISHTQKSEGLAHSYSTTLYPTPLVLDTSLRPTQIASIHRSLSSGMGGFA
jgi:hypothetical protein